MKIRRKRKRELSHFKMAATEKKIPGYLIALLVLTGTAAFVFLPNLSAEFLLDDKILIENNPFIRQLENFSTYLAQEDGVLDRDNWDESFHTRYYRPLINFTYHLDYRIWGLNPVGFHFTNWLLHLFTSFLLYHLLFRFTGNAWASLTTAVLFAVHPVQTEAVSWISSRNNILATLFSLAAFHFYTLPASRRWIGSLIPALWFFSLAIFSKEFGVMMLPILFIYDRIYQKKSAAPGKSWLSYLPFALVLVVYWGARSHVTGSMMDISAGVSFAQRLLYTPYLIMYNFVLVLLPMGLHNFLVYYPNEWAGFYAAGGMAGLFLIGSLLWRHYDDKMVVFGVLAFLVGLFPVLNLIPTSAVTLVAMRWLYFPLAFLSFAVCRLVGDQASRFKIAVLLLIAVFLGSYSHYLNREHWHDETGFFTREVLKFNNHLYAGAYARILQDKGENDLAEKYFRLGIKAIPSLVENYADYAAMLISQNQPGKALVVIKRGEHLAMSRTNKGIFYNNKGMALSKLGRPYAAIAAFEKAIALSPRNLGMISNLGSAYGIGGEYEKSVKILLSGLQLDPDSIGLRKNLANTYLKMGDFENAIGILEEIPIEVRLQNPGVENLLQRARASG